ALFLERRRPQFQQQRAHLLDGRADRFIQRLQLWLQRRAGREGLAQATGQGADGEEVLRDGVVELARDARALAQTCVLLRKRLLLGYRLVQALGHAVEVAFELAHLVRARLGNPLREVA